MLLQLKWLEILFEWIELFLPTATAMATATATVICDGDGDGGGDGDGDQDLCESALCHMSVSSSLRFSITDF